MYLVPVNISPIFVGSLFFNNFDTNHFVVKYHLEEENFFSIMNSIIEVEKANYRNSNCYCHCLSCLSCFYKAWPIFYLSEFECSKMNNTVSEQNIF